MRNTLLLAAFPLAAIVIPVAALAQQAGWDGTWVGRTAKGGDISISIASGAATEYIFRGESVPINQSAGSGKSFEMTVGQMNGTVRLIKSGASRARYSYSDSAGGSATAALMRQ